jgi:HAD superfamily hydrolase (TIGR01509 family)
MTLKAVFFDFNGTIINDEAIHAELTQQILLAENLRPDMADYQRLCWGRSDRACLRGLLRQRGRVVSDDYLQQLITQKAQGYRDRLAALDTLPLYAGVEAFIKKLHSIDLVLGLVTGADRAAVDLVLARSQLAPYFSILVTADDGTESKPAPASYQLAIQRAQQQYPQQQIAPQRCLAIEDTLVGIAAAKAAGIQVVGIAHTYPFHMLQRQANWTVDKFTELELERVEQVVAQQDAAFSV